MKNKKGFVLSGMLLFLLSIFPVLATFSILGTIEDSRVKTYETSTEALIKATKVYYMSEIMKGNEPKLEIDLSIDKDTIKAETMAKSGIITIIIDDNYSEPVIEAKNLDFGDYICEYSYEIASCDKK